MRTSRKTPMRRSIPRAWTTQSSKKKKGKREEVGAVTGTERTMNRASKNLKGGKERSARTGRGSAKKKRFVG